MFLTSVQVIELILSFVVFLPFKLKAHLNMFGQWLCQCVKISLFTSESTMFPHILILYVRLCHHMCSTVETIACCRQQYLCTQDHCCRGATW